VPAPVTGLTATQPVDGVPEVLLSWSHDGIDLDRFMLGFEVDGAWTNLEPQAATQYGSGPYSFTVPSLPGATWRVVALDSTGAVSA
jgi:hypothetical protein